MQINNRIKNAEHIKSFSRTPAYLLYPKALTHITSGKIIEVLVLILTSFSIYMLPICRFIMAKEVTL